MFYSACYFMAFHNASFLKNALLLPMLSAQCYACPCAQYICLIVYCMQSWNLGMELIIIIFEKSRNIYQQRPAFSCYWFTILYCTFSKKYFRSGIYAAASNGNPVGRGKLSKQFTGPAQ
jgi:hypothetical protein